MKHLKVTWFIVCLMLIVGGCTTTDKGETSILINSGTYELQAQQVAVNNNIVSGGPVGGGYFAELLHFSKGDSLQIEIKSDIVSENGQAKATYRLQNSTLLVTITSSTTSQYTTGEEVTFTDYKLLNESFTQIFQTNGESYTFQGPGLLLRQQYTDQQDLDDDSDISEMVSQTKYYKYLIRYDDGSK